MKTDKEGVKQMVGEKFRRWTNELSESVTDEDGNENKVCSFSTFLCNGLCQCTRYSPRSAVSEPAVWKGRENTLQLMQRSPSLPRDLLVLKHLVCRCYLALLLEELVVNGVNMCTVKGRRQTLLNFDKFVSFIKCLKRVPII